MGKRRTEFEHKDPRSMGDDDDDEDEEIIVEQEPLNQEQRDLISKRKKLVPKRKFAPGSNPSIPSDSPFATLKPFPILPTANNITTSSEDSGNKSIFTGFKGFTGFKPLEPTTTTTPSISSTAKPAPVTTSTEPKPLTTSVFTNGASKSTESTNGHSSDSTKGSKNINEIEMKFIAGLNELYDKCYGETAPKRQYRLPVDVSSPGDQSDQVEAKYASLLAELNRNCSKWISKHVEESPFVILTPVFVDYFNYLILLEKSFFPETFKQTTVLNGDGHLNGHKEHTSQPKLDLTRPPSSEEKKPESSLPSLSSSTPFGLFKFGSGNANSGGGDEPGAAKPSMPTISLSFLNSKTNEPGEAKTQSNIEEPKKDTTTKSATTPATNMFKFGSDNTPKISFGSSIATDSKPSESPSLFKTTTANPEKPAEASLPSITSSSSSLTPFSILNTEKETPKLDSTSSTSIFKPLSSIGSTPFSTIASSSPSSFLKTPLTTPSINPAPTTTPTFSFGQQSTISTLGGSSSILSGSASSTTQSPFVNFQFGANKTPGFGSGTSLFGGASTGMFGSGSSATLGSGAASAEAEGGDDDKEEYQPPKPESSDVKEDGAVFTKRIKLYYFNDKEKKFADRGIGNLFVKPVQKEGAESSYQLIIRADNKLAQILLNVKLNKLFPVTREGPKDVSYLCLPNPPIQSVDSSVPCKFLFKVKTETDADELLDKLNEYKK